jgi:hypothetical protein
MQMLEDMLKVADDMLKAAKEIHNTAHPVQLAFIYLGVAGTLFSAYKAVEEQVVKYKKKEETKTD